ncbi:hypothetical protein ST47_g881 [Ascochyta rabiei]|uniref:Uncharacterized protein n=1 Tax=Didymella rabiei TaxID=5454 RepID=A0A163LNY2_DIDRA|nr:hypothetical protein ST47_g881 [Ascochyta rabiei]
MRLTAAQNEHARFFREVKAIWEELASWGDDLRVEVVFFNVAGFSVYKFVGPDVCSEDFSTLLDFSSLPKSPLLPSVKSLWVREETNEEIDLWPTKVTCSVASSLPTLECLKTVGVDYEDYDAPATSRVASWPNLRILDISTGLERPSGDYWLRAWPVRRFLTRPEPAFFDELAVSMARAVSSMPKLEYLDLEFNASHQGALKPDVTNYNQAPTRYGGFRPHLHQYEGWTFYFCASNEAKFASKYSRPYWFEHKPGLDRTDIERPRTEWVFQCPHGHLEWEEPEVAKVLWREKCPHIDFDVVALDGVGTSWERRRNGNLVPLLGKGFATKFPEMQDLDEIPEGLE